MSEGKMREEFEAWMHTFDLPPQLSGAVFADDRYKHSPLFGEFIYDDHSTQRCWAAWQASRAALEIELPHPHETAKRYMDAEAKFSHKEGIDECRAAIEAAGVRVK